MAELRVMSMNCRGLGSQQKRRDVLNYIKQAAYDVILLQDTHITTRTVPYFDALWRGKCFHSCKTGSSRGSSILVKSTVSFNILEERMCDSGNLVILVCSIASNIYTFVSVYGPNEDNPRFFEILEEHLDSLPSENIIIGGDLNFVMDLKKDSNYVHNNNPNAKTKFIDIMKKYDLADVWRHFHPDELQFTWLKRNPLKFGRLDMFIASDHLLPNLSNCVISPGYRTDHSIISMTITEPDQERGPYLWKFNDSLLSDDDYVQRIKNRITEAVTEYAVPLYSEAFLSDPKNYDAVQCTIDIGLFYETLLMLLRGETVKYSKQKARMRKAEELSIMNRIDDFRKRLPEELTEENVNELKNMQNRLESLRAPKIQGLITRSRVAWYDQGERSSKYFLSLEKRNAIRKTIQCLRCDDRIVRKRRDILQELTGYFSLKYTASLDFNDATEYLQNNITRRLNDLQKQSLDEPLSLRELTSALMSMKKGKSPGSNGFTAAFFKHFWSHIGVFLLRVFNEGVSKGCLINTFREGIVTLIPKTGKPADSVKGWRPISLLNTDFKIISAAITNRLKSVMSELISPNQSAYIKGRCIAENSRLVYDVIDFLNRNEKCGFILAADIEAAFESVSWTFLREALDHYNFGSKFKRWIQLVYLSEANFSRIMLSGFLGDKIYLHQGIRQGDPASGYLFNLAMEPLTNQILQSERIRGIRIRELEIKISQYADDAIMFLEPNASSLKGAIEEMEIFSSFSGLHTNVSKTKCMPIGCSERIVNSLGVSYVEEIKILGITFNGKNQEVTDRNIAAILPRVEKEIVQWKRRNLSIIGKITVIKSLLMSKLVHILMALPNPSRRMVKQIESIWYKFLWKGRKDLVKRTKVVQGYNHDGMKMIDLWSFIKSMKVSWIKRLHWSNHGWARLIQTELPNLEFIEMYGYKKAKEEIKHIPNQFWADVTQAWGEFIELYEVSSEEMLSDWIWYSNYTKFACEKVRKWDSEGLRFIHDLINLTSGTLLTREQLHQRYGVRMTFLCYQSLIRSLPSDIRNLTNSIQLSSPVIPYKIALLARSSNLSRIAYQSFIKSLRSKYKDSQATWSRKWIRDIDLAYVGSIADIRIATKNTYLQSFHFRLVSRILTTNRFLHLIGLSDNSNCTFCLNDCETLVHLFWTCPRVQGFIRSLEIKLQSMLDLTVVFDEKMWFLPTLEKNSQIEVLLITIAKVAIYKARSKDQQPSVDHFLYMLRLEAEKEIGSARISGKLAAFDEKWGVVKNILESSLLERDEPRH